MFVIVDSGCPSYLVGRGIVEAYTVHNNLDLNKLEAEIVDKYFKFGENRYHSRQAVVLPIKMKTKESCLETSVKVYIVDEQVPFILGLNTMVLWDIYICPKCGEVMVKGNNMNEITPTFDKKSQHKKIKLCPIIETTLGDSFQWLIKKCETDQIQDGHKYLGEGLHTIRWPGYMNQNSLILEKKSF